MTGKDSADSSESCEMEDFRVTYIAAINSLINNSCVSNAKEILVKNQEIVLYALEPIKKNSQVCKN